jgi:hypothetical protein
MMHHYMLCEQRRLLQWLSPSFSVFQSSPLLIASPIALGRNGIPKAYFAGICWYRRTVLHGSIDCSPLIF